MIRPVQEIASQPHFAAASHAVLEYLSEKFGFDLWMMTRTDGDDWIVLQANDQGYGVVEGTVFRWADSFCSRMVDGRGPMATSHVDTVEIYRDAPIGRQVKIGAYMGSRSPVRTAPSSAHSAESTPIPSSPRWKRSCPWSNCWRACWG